MEGLLQGEHIVFPYEDTLFTQSPLLRRVYCESHRFEPWLVRGDSKRVGRYRFPRVLYMSAADRHALLAYLEHDVWTSAPAMAPMRQRTVGAMRTLIRTRRAIATREPSGAHVRVLLTAMAQVLSVGVVKEVLTVDKLVQTLKPYCAQLDLAPLALALLQPHCLPHHIKFRAAVLYWAAKMREGDSDAAKRCIARAAHFSRFLLEPTTLHDENAMKRHLQEAADAEGDAGQLRAARRELFVRNQASRRRAFDAEALILNTIAGGKKRQWKTLRLVRAQLRFFMWTATYEELKHIAVMDAARTCRQLMEDFGLDIERTDTPDLLAALGG